MSAGVWSISGVNWGRLIGVRFHLTAIAQAGYPKRPAAKPGFEAELRKRTLTNLYNARPVWLTMAHEALDIAVAAAYDWPDYTPATPDDDILRQLLTLNLERSQPEIKAK